MPKPPLDQFDSDILRELQNDGRQTNVTLADRIGLSPTPCLRRVRRLETDGFIEGYGALLNRRKVGLGLTAFVSIGIGVHNDENAAAFEEAMQRRPEVVACHVVTGDADFLLEVVAPDLETYSSFVLNTLLKLPGVNDVRSSFSMKAVKTPSVLPIDLALGTREAE